MNVGYVRTSTSDQTAGLDAQARDLKAAGAERIFSEQVSSVAKRAKLAECLAFLREGDVLTVTKPDRLARSTAELLTIEADLSKRGIGLVVLSMGGERLDTRKPTSKLMLTILAGVATWEREIMLERQREGIAKAKAEGNTKAARSASMRRRSSSSAPRWVPRRSRSVSASPAVRSTACSDSQWEIRVMPHVLNYHRDRVPAGAVAAHVPRRSPNIAPCHGGVLLEMANS